jgi:hypothetical protein
MVGPHIVGENVLCAQEGGGEFHGLRLRDDIEMAASSRSSGGLVRMPPGDGNGH